MRRRSEQGYILLTLLLVVTLMTIAAAIIVSDLKFEMKRDREEEMVHRGVQYSRAIRAYYKKFGRYPAKIEDLESSNRLRFLRKRYKDPLNCAKGTCNDFKLLHFGEVQMAGNALGNALGTPAAAMTGPNGSVGVAPGGLNSPGTQGAATASSDASQDTSGAGTVASQPGAQNGSTGFSGTSSTGFGNSGFGSSGPGGAGPGGNGPGGSSAGSPGGFLSGGNNTTFGGAPIVGVASDFRCPPHKKEECTTIREYDKKTKYADWKFIYDPTMDRGTLITTPYQSQIPGFGQTSNLNGQNNGSSSGLGNGGLGNSGFGSSGFGSNSGFGSSGGGFGSTPGFQNSPSSGFGNQNPPPSPPPQQP
jgi:type II secretory pathway pseudopilin PulG